MLLHETSIVYGRYLRQSLRSRFALLFGVLMPLLYLVFFGPLLTGLPLGGRGSSWQVLVPGLLLQLGLFGALFSGFVIILEQGQGVVERMRVTPSAGWPCCWAGCCATPRSSSSRRCCWSWPRWRWACGHRWPGS